MLKIKLKRGIAKNKKKAITFMIVPPSEGSIKSVAIPMSLLYVVSAGALIALTLFLMSYFGLMADAHRFKKIEDEKNTFISTLLDENTSLKSSYAEQEKALASLVGKTEQLENKLIELDKLGEEIRGLVKGKSSTSSRNELASRSGSDWRKQLSKVATQLEDDDVRTETIDNLLKVMETAIPELEAEVARQEKELKALYNEAKSYRTKLDHTPSIWPVTGRITSTFGFRWHPTDGARKMHDGYDIAVPVGTPIRATADGTVKFAGWKSGYGYIIEINHGYGIETAYAHNSRLVVKRNQKVKKGQIIAYSGNTGKSTGPHLHYEVRVNGRPVNPRTYLP